MVDFFRVSAKRIYLLAFPLGVIAAGLYSPVIQLVSNKPEVVESVWPLVVLVTGLVVCAGVLPFQSIFVMGGKPGWQSLFLAASVLINLLLNVLLVPIYGVIGSAIGTSLAMVLSSGILIALSLWLFSPKPPVS